MPFEIVVDAGARILRARYSGSFAIEDRVTLARHVLEASRRTGIHRWLLDFRDSQSLGSDGGAVTRMADEFTPQLPSGLRMAYLVRYDHQLDDSLEVVLRSRGVQVERFLRLDDAVAWLKAPAAEAGETRTYFEAPDPPALSRAVRLAAEAIGPATRLSPDQFAAISELVHVLLSRGLDDATVLDLGGRISAAMNQRVPE